MCKLQTKSLSRAREKNPRVRCRRGRCSRHMSHSYRTAACAMMAAARRRGMTSTTTMLLLLLLMLASTAHAGCRVCEGPNSPTANGTLLPCGPGNGERRPLSCLPACLPACCSSVPHLSKLPFFRPPPLRAASSGWSSALAGGSPATCSLLGMLDWRCRRLVPSKQDSLLWRAHQRPGCQRRQWLR